MKDIKQVLWLGLALLGGGCAVTPPQSGPSSSAPEVAAAPQETPAAPEVAGEIPPAVLYQLLVGEIAAQRGQAAVAVGSYLEAAKTSRDAEVAARATRIANAAQALPQALEAASLWVELAPDDAEARRALAPLLLTFGRAPEAEEQYQKYIELSADKEAHGFRQVASQLSWERNRVAAMAVMDKLLATWPKEPDAWLAHAWLSMRQGKFEQAITSLDKALSMKPRWDQAVALRAQVLALQGDKPGALAYLDKQMKGDLAEDAMLVGLHARLLSETGQLQQALDEFERLADREPDNVDAQYAAGVLALQLNDLNKAKGHLEHVLSLGQRSLESSYFLGRIGELQGDDDSALRYYLAVRHGEFYLTAQARAAALLAKRGMLDRAREHLHSLRVSNTQERLRLYLVEGELLRDAGEYQQAFDFYTEKLKEMPDETSLRYARALVAERLDKLDLAEQDLRAVIEREPSNAQALNALGYTLADRTTRYQEALELIQRALEAEPKDAAIIDSMGWVQYRLGHLQEAVTNLRHALELTADPEVAAHLGEVLWTMGKQDEAKALWREYLGKFPGHKALLDVMKRFGQ